MTGVQTCALPICPCTSSVAVTTHGMQVVCVMCACLLGLRSFGGLISSNGLGIILIDALFLVPSEI